MLPLLAALILLGIPCNATPQLPQLPQKWSAVVEATISNKNYSMVQQEVYDYPANRMRVTTRSGRSEYSHHSISLFSIGLVITWSGDPGDPGYPITCIGQDQSAAAASHMASTGGHLRPSGEFLAFGGPNRNETYMGTAHARGILCDVWMSSTAIPGLGAWNLSYYFIASHWSVHGSVQAAIDSVPVRAELVGWRASPHFHQFSHLYEFVDWQPRAPETSFLPPSAGCDMSAYCASSGASSTVCAQGLSFLVERSSSSVCTAADLGCDTGGNQTGAVVGWVVGGIFGLVIGVAVTSVVCVRRQQKAELAEQVEMEGMREPNQLGRLGCKLSEDDASATSL